MVEDTPHFVLDVLADSVLKSPVPLVGPQGQTLTLEFLGQNQQFLVNVQQPRVETPAQVVPEIGSEQGAQTPVQGYVIVSMYLLVVGVQSSRNLVAIIERPGVINPPECSDPGKFESSGYV